MSEIPERQEDIEAAERACDLCGVTKYSDLRIYARQVALSAIRAERERAKSVCDCWLSNFGTKPIIDTPAHVYATAAVEDVRDLIVGKGA